MLFYFAANCLDPGPPYQGKTIDQDFRHGRTVRFTCPINYVMEGVAAIKCTDGQWNNNKPSCKGNITSVTLLEKQRNIHNKTNQAHQKAFASAIERKKVVLRLRQTSKGHTYINLRPGQYLTHAYGHITPTVAAMDSCFALFGAHKHGIVV